MSIVGGPLVKLSCSFQKLGLDHLSNQIDNNPYVVHIIRLASSSSTRCEGETSA